MVEIIGLHVRTPFRCCYLLVTHHFSIVFPLIFHSIQDEIPQASKQLITRLYQLWLVLVVTLVINMIACIFILVSGEGNAGSDLGSSIG